MWLLKCYEESGSILKRSRMDMTSMKNADILILADSQMEQDDETSLVDLKIIADGRSQRKCVFQVALAARTYMLMQSGQHFIAVTDQRLDRNWFDNCMTETGAD